MSAKEEDVPLPSGESDDDISKGSDWYERRRPRVCRNTHQSNNSWHLSPLTFFGTVILSTCITTASVFIFRPMNCECGQNSLRYEDIHEKLEEIIKSVREEKHSTLQPDRNNGVSMHDTAKTLPKHRLLPRQILVDVKKLSLIKNVLRKEQRRLAAQYAETKKRRMTYARKIMLKGAQANDSSNGLICENPSNPLYQYDCVYGNKGLDIDGTDVFDVSLQLELINEVFNEGDLLFELGLVYGKDINQRKQIPGITGYRCKQMSGVCLELFGRDSNELSKNEVDSKLVESHFSFKLHEQNILFIKDDILQSIFKIESDRRHVFLYPACVVYNPHLANISVSIVANTDISFNISSIDNHIFVSDDNKTISNLPIIYTLRERWFKRWFNIKYPFELIIVLVLLILTVCSLWSTEEVMTSCKSIAKRSFVYGNRLDLDQTWKEPLEKINAMLVFETAILGMCLIFILVSYIYFS